MTEDGRNHGAEPRRKPLDHIELTAFFPYRLSMLDLAVSKALANLYSGRFNLSRNEWRSMAALGNLQPMSANEICQATDMDKVQVSRAVASLINNDLVVDEGDRRDRRRSKLRLTDKGMRIYRQIVPMAQAREAFLLSGISDEEYQQLLTIMDKLQDQARLLQQQG